MMMMPADQLAEYYPRGPAECESSFSLLFG